MPTPALNIGMNGIVQRFDDGRATILRPHRNGGVGAEVEVPRELADSFHLATGDVVAGATAPMEAGRPRSVEAEIPLDDEDIQVDEPAAARGVYVPLQIGTQLWAMERLATVESINGVGLPEAMDRPPPRRRWASERALPDRWIPLAVSPEDETGRALDRLAPLGAGCAGIITGPHGSGLTRALRAVVAGAQANAPDLLTLLLLLRARSEEITDWRRRFPGAEIVVCPAAPGAGRAEDTLRVADLVLECARRQTEMGRHVLLAVDSLTGLWGAMLEAEGADAQTDADQSQSRTRVRDWVQAAGNFTGAPPLASVIGGSLTLVGAVWNQEIDPEAEEEREIHPHLRLVENIIHDTTWRVGLSGELARRRLFPAIDSNLTRALDERSYVPPEVYERNLELRAALSGRPLIERWNMITAREG